MKKLLALIVMIVCLTASASAAIIMPGMQAPDFEAPLISGETFKLSEQRGKVVLLNIWATWCGPCVAEMPDIDQLAKDYADDLVVIGVNCGEPEKDVVSFIEKNGYTYPIALDTDYLVSGMLYPTSSIPYTVVINPMGEITQVHTGGGKGMYEVFEDYVQDALASVQGEVELMA